MDTTFDWVDQWAEVRTQFHDHIIGPLFIDYEEEQRKLRLEKEAAEKLKEILAQTEDDGSDA